MAERKKPVLLEMREITKEFPGVRALDRVSFSLQEGDIHCLVGENGAGKSTLMKILSGVHPYGSYTGDIIINGEVQEFHNVRDSEEAGIGIVYQEISLIPELSVYENLFFGHEITKPGLFFKHMDWDKTIKEAQAILDRVHLNVDPATKVKYLGVGQQQLVQIAMNLSRDSRILILDEPTAALNDVESARLLELLRELRDDGVNIIMISHKLNEVLEIADSITVLRDGSTVANFDAHEQKPDRQDLIRNMVGREIQDIYGQRNIEIKDEKLLEVKNWSCKHPQTGRELLTDIDFYVRPGEVVGISGLMGAGRTELALSIFGNTKHYDISPESKLYFHGKEVRFNRPEDAIEAGVAYVSEDRKETGLVLIQSVRYNTSLANLDRISNGIVVDEVKERHEVHQYTEQMRVKTPTIEQVVNNLSGGNQQKVVLAKWLFAEPELLILDEPTRGIDIGAKQEIYDLINAMVEQGKSIIMISSELPEVLGLCDRIYVLADGFLAGELSHEEANEVEVMALATLTRQDRAQQAKQASQAGSSSKSATQDVHVVQKEG